MLAPCDLLAGRGDSPGPRTLSRRWLRLVTRGGGGGGKVSSQSDKTSDAHDKINAECRTQSHNAMRRHAFGLMRCVLVGKWEKEQFRTI